MYTLHKFNGVYSVHDKWAKHFCNIISQTVTQKLKSHMCTNDATIFLLDLRKLGIICPQIFPQSALDKTWFEFDYCAEINFAAIQGDAHIVKCGKHGGKSSNWIYVSVEQIIGKEGRHVFRSYQYHTNTLCLLCGHA